jgi:DNA-binding NarL/FixJ family response regulator
MLSQSQRTAILELSAKGVSIREIAQVLRLSRLSRVRHYCHTVTINGPSLREPQG